MNKRKSDEIITRLPDVESLEKKVPYPKVIRVLQATETGQREKDYYDFETWSQKFWKQRRKVAYSIFGNRPRFLPLFILYKTGVVSIGFFLRLLSKITGLYRKYLLPEAIKQDMKVMREGIKENFGGFRSYIIRGYVDMFYTYLAVDNAYRQRYLKIKEKFLKKNQEEES